MLMCVFVRSYTLPIPPVFVLDMRLHSFYHIIICQCDDCVLQSASHAVI